MYSIGASSLVHSGLKKIGIDRAVGYTLLSRLWSMLAGPVSILLIARYLSSVQQGYYYTFNSILALQVFFELGLSNVVMQVVSHERAHLEFSQAGFLEGSVTAKSRLASLLKTTSLWYAVIAFLAAAVLLPVGLWFFGRGATSGAVTWRVPWTGVVLFTAANLFLSPFLSFLEGCGLVSEVAGLRARQAVLAYLALWLGLWQRLGLTAMVASGAASTVVILVWLVAKRGHFFRDIVAAHTPTVAIRWRQEIWPFQWRIAVSWLGGYLIFQVFNPILFTFQGPVVAGQMGLSLSVLWSLGILATSWVSTKAPMFGTLIAQRRYEELDKLFGRAMLQCFVVMLLIGCSVWGGVVFLNRINSPFAARALDPVPFGLLTVTMIVNQIIWAEAYYLRAHKREPLMWITVLVGVLNVVLAYWLGQSHGALGIALMYCLLTCLVNLPVCTWIFVTKRRAWHQGA